MPSIPASPGESLSNALIVAQMRPVLLRFFKRKCGGSHEAEDLTQDVLTRALGHATWDSPEQAKGYIFRSAINRWRDRQRMAHAHGITLEWNESLESEFNEETGPEHVLIVEQELNRVASALLELDERTRDVFTLIRLEQMKQKAVAEMLGISVSLVEKELVKALAHLARRAKRWNGRP